MSQGLSKFAKLEQMKIDKAEANRIAAAKRDAIIQAAAANIPNYTSVVMVKVEADGYVPNH
jgi:hypothetical protein